MKEKPQKAGKIIPPLNMEFTEAVRAFLKAKPPEKAAKKGKKSRKP